MITARNQHDVRDFQEVYHTLRSREQRILTNDEVRRLPDIAADHPLHKEWKLRQQSTARLLTYLGREQRHLDILEVGCGNGWLSNQLANINDTTITGIDVHEEEINQARQVFGARSNIDFIYGDFFSGIIPLRPDIIVFAASFQYFAFPGKAIEHSLSLLNNEGEVHILDTAFYHENERPAAVLRSAEHFEEIDVPGMSRHYFHHCWSDLEPFKYEVLYSPSRLIGMLGISRNPFPWICIKK